MCPVFVLFLGLLPNLISHPLASLSEVDSSIHTLISALLFLDHGKPELSAEDDDESVEDESSQGRKADSNSGVGNAEMLARLFFVVGHTAIKVHHCLSLWLFSLCDSFCCEHEQF